MSLRNDMRFSEVWAIKTIKKEGDIMNFLISLSKLIAYDNNYLFDN